jgi:hypothetical protein
VAQVTFEDELKRLQDEFLSQRRLNESPEEIGFALLGFILDRERIRFQMRRDDPNLLAMYVSRLAKLAIPNALGPEYAVAEGVFRRLASDPAEASAYLNRFIESRSASQSARASKQRKNGHGTVTRYIRLYLEEYPNASAKDVERELLTISGLIFIGDEIRVEGSDEEPVKLANLPSRISDAKKSLRRNRAS